MIDAPILTRPMVDADVDAVVALLGRALGPAPGGVDRRALFDWKHLSNPFGRSIALVAELEGGIVGLRSFMRWRLGCGDEGITAVRAVDTATSPQVQRRGIFSRLTSEALELCRDAGIAFVFNTPNEKSRPGYLKMGWRVVTTCPVWLKARRPVRIGIAVARRDLASGGSVAAPDGSSLVPAVEVLDVAASVAKDARAPSALHTERTRDYLAWRYAGGPFTYWALEGPGSVVIGRLRARGRLREAVITEALAAPGAEADLRELLRRYPSEAGADHGVAHFGPGWDARASLAGAGYRRLPRAGIVMTARSIHPTRPDPLDPSSWSLSLGELEVF